MKVLHKTLDILDRLRQSPDGLGLAELCTSIGMPKPTVHRILSTLETRGYVSRAAGTGYQVSRKLFTETANVSATERLLRAARPVMAQLAAATGETVNLGVLDGGEVLVIETVESQQAVRMSSKTGNRRFPHSTALGKIFLASLPRKEAARIVRSKGMPRFTPATIVRERDLMAELDRIRIRKYAIDNMENEPDGRCIAAAVQRENEDFAAALSISGPLPRMTLARAKSMLPLLAAACQSITTAALAPD